MYVKCTLNVAMQNALTPSVAKHLSLVMLKGLDSWLTDIFMW